MEKWLMEELEAKARMEQFDKERKALLTVKCRSDFEVPVPAAIRLLHIDQYTEAIDASVYHTYLSFCITVTYPGYPHSAGSHTR